MLSLSQYFFTSIGNRFWSGFPFSRKPLIDELLITSNFETHFRCAFISRFRRLFKPVPSWNQLTEPLKLPASFWSDSGLNPGSSIVQNFPSLISNVLNPNGDRVVSSMSPLITDSSCYPAKLSYLRYWLFSSAFQTLGVISSDPQCFK